MIIKNGLNIFPAGQFSLQDFWYGKWIEISNNDDREWLEWYGKDLEQRISKYRKFKWQVIERI